MSPILSACPVPSIFPWPSHPYYSTFFTMASQSTFDSILSSSQAESQLELVTEIDEFSSTDVTSIFDDDKAAYHGFATTSNRKYAIWDSKYHIRWCSWWTEKLEGHPNFKHFENVGWGKIRRSTIWNQFHQAVEIKTGLPKAVCQVCSQAYAHPFAKGSSTSTLARHRQTCIGPKQSQLDKHIVS
jgi:hypothetical protein